MKHASLVVALLALVAAPAWAEEGHVSKSTLNALGLSGMQNVSDADGMAIRGKLVFSTSVKGTSLVFGQLLTPNTKNFLVASSVNEVDGDASTAGDPVITKDHLVFIGTFNGESLAPANLSVSDPGRLIFNGSMGALVGGFGSVSFGP